MLDGLVSSLSTISLTETFVCKLIEELVTFLLIEVKVDLKTLLK